MADEIKYPFGDCDAQALTAGGAQAITITDQLTIIDGVTVESTSHRTLNLTIGAEVKAGAEIFIKSQANGSENFVFGTGCTAPTFAGSAGCINTIELRYDGTTFKPKALSIKIN